VFDWLKKKEKVEAVPEDPFDAALADLMLQALGVKESDSVLELGFGGGQALRHLVPLLTRGRYVGLDSSPLLVARANESFPAEFAHFKLEFREGVVSRIPYPDRLFNMAFTLQNVGTWLNIPKGLREMHRVLVPGGKVGIGLLPSHRVQGTYVPSIELRAMLRDQGFDDIQTIDPPTAGFASVAVGVKASH
jgi:SAM-dependent methyltransferase